MAHRFTSSNSSGNRLTLFVAGADPLQAARSAPASPRVHCRRVPCQSYAFYGLADGLLDEMGQRGRLTCAAVKTSRTTLRITANVAKPPAGARICWGGKVRVRLADGTAGSRPEAVKLFEAIAPFLTAVLADPEHERADATVNLADGHHFRIRWDIGATWRILVSVRKIEVLHQRPLPYERCCQSFL